MRIALVILLCSGLCFTAQAQQKPGNPGSNRVRKFINARPDTLRLDSLSIIPGTLYITDLPDSAWKADFVNAVLYWRIAQRPDSVRITYRTFPRKLNAVVQQYNFDSVKNNFLRPFVFRNTATPGGVFNFGNMDYTGSFGRAISFGNAQDAVVNSNFNLQISGLLADSIELTAALSDQNLPVQPDGNTAQLNEIDRIWIQLKKQNWQLNLGDIDLRRNSQYFLNFYKRMQGVSFENAGKIGKQNSHRYLVSGAIAKGKFTSNNFNGQEGNQGPYRLQGANNEFFFILLAGTEKVFIDGEQLQRGEDQDYIVNYNTAEITFMPKRLITKDKRIRVEFEYADRNYLNAQLYGEEELQFKNKLKLRLGVFSNSDSKSNPLNQEINPQQRLFMSGIGDNVTNAYYPNIVRDTLTPGKILYKQKDTTYNSITQRIYIYTTNPDSARYALTFADLGAGKGDYMPLFNGANGKVFVWIQPVNGIKQGRYEPVQFIVAPRKQQMASLTAEYQLSKNHFLKTDLAVSRNDVNTFSELEKENDVGMAGKLSYTGKFISAQKQQRKNYLELQTEYEALNKNFRTVERLRTPEFNRDWNLPFITAFTSEQLGAFSLSYKNDNGNYIKVLFNNYFRGEQYRGFRQSVSSLHNIRGFTISSQLSYTSTNDSAIRGTFFRPALDVSRVFKKLRNLRAGAGFLAEENRLLNKQPDTLGLLSQAFQSWKVFVQSAQEKPNKWSLIYIARTNHIPVKKDLPVSDRSNDISFTTSIEANPNRKFNLTATWRKLDVELPDKVTFKSENTLLGRAEYRFAEWKGLLTGRLVYESGSGQEQRRDLAYLEVPAGQGEYYWIDYNNNGAQELNEFELALYPDQRKFIRIFVPTNEFIKANFTTFDYQLALNPAARIKPPKQKGFRKLLSRTFWQTGYQVNKKETGSGLELLNPFRNATDNAALILLNSILSNSLSLNRQNSNKWSADLNQVNSTTKSLLTYGYETREIQTRQLKARFAINRKLLWEGNGKLVNNRLITPGFANRNYDIAQSAAGSNLTYIRNSGFRIQAGYLYEHKQNDAAYGGEKAIIHSLNSEMKYNALQSLSFNGRFTYSNIKFTGAAGSTVAFTMMDGLLPGQNFLWVADVTKVLGRNLELIFRYEGRKAGETRIIHTGTASLRAAFY